MQSQHGWLACSSILQSAYIDRVGPFILVAVAIEDNVGASIIQHILHSQPHALSLLVVRYICSKHSLSVTA